MAKRLLSTLLDVEHTEAPDDEPRRLTTGARDDIDDRPLRDDASKDPARWGTLLRLLLSTIWLIWVLLSHPWLQSLWIPLALYCGLSVVGVVLIRNDQFPTSRMFMFLFMDVAITTVAVQGFGSQSTILTGFYLLIILGYTLQRRRNLGFVALLLSLASYGGLLVLEGLGILPEAPLLEGELDNFAGLQAAATRYAVVGILLISTYLFVQYVLFEIKRYHDRERDLVDAERRAEVHARALERRKEESLRLEGIGRLAGGVAHDFNNLLTVINGYSKLALDGLPVSSPLRDKLRLVVDSGERAAALTRQLLTFGQQQLCAPSRVDLDAAIEGMTTLLGELVEGAVTIELEPPSEPLPIHIDPSQLEQVVVNLVVNARDAMPGGGRVVIATDRIELDDSRSGSLAALPEGSYARLVITDEGEGMDPATAAHIFEPFFTTKSQGKGTGLGLSTVYGVVMQADGAIEVETTPGHGTSFVIHLPLLAGSDDELAESGTADATLREPAAIAMAGGADAAMDDPTSSPTTPAPGDGPTILLVEDDTMVRTLSCQLLRGLGYEVLPAADGASALSIVEGGRPLDLLLTDVVMPGMSGPELVEAVLASHPDLPVLYMSGHTTSRTELQRGSSRPAPMLAKPFTSAALGDAVRGALGEEAPPRDVPLEGRRHMS